MRTAVCTECGKAFKTNANYIKYCPECKKIILKRRQKAANAKYKAAHKKPSKTYEVVCAVCGKKFLTTLSRKKICSKECLREWARRRSNKWYHSLEDRLTPEQLAAWKYGRSEYARINNSRPEVKARARELAKIRRFKNDLDPKKREMRLARRRKMDYMAGRSHPPKPRVTKEHIKMVHDLSVKRWYQKVYTKGKADYDAGIMTADAIHYEKTKSRIRRWQNEHPERVAVYGRRSRLKRGMLDAYGKVNAAWLSMGIVE